MANAPEFLELDFEARDFAPTMRRCLTSGIPFFFVIRGRHAARLREFVSGDTIDNWARMGVFPPLNLVSVAISLASILSMRHRVVVGDDFCRVEFFPVFPDAN